MCIYCQSNKSIETHNTNSGLYTIEIEVCKDCSIRKGFRSVNWYKNHEHELDFDWTDL